MFSSHRSLFSTCRPRRRLWALLAVAAAAASSVSGCGGHGSPAAAGSSVGPLAAVCPSTVVVQLSWYSDGTHGGLYQLLGPGYRVEVKGKRVVGRLFDRGQDTGLGLEIRAGGPAVGYEPVSSLMAKDQSITFGQQATEEQVDGAAQGEPTTAVVSTLDQDPLVYMWDADVHPTWNQISDIGQTKTKVVTLRSPDASYLTGTGILKESQLDYSYDGSPQRLMADRSLAVGGFATNELYRYQQLGVRVGYAYVHDTGDPGYRNALTVRTGGLPALDGCLRRLVPVLQRAHVDFMARPDRALAIIAAADTAYPATFPYDLKAGKAAVAVMRKDGLVANGPGQFFGSFDPVRVEKEIELLRPIYAGQHITVPAELGAGDLSTGIYLDHTVRLPAE
jgi:hypothetical protein